MGEVIPSQGDSDLAHDVGRPSPIYCARRLTEVAGGARLEDARPSLRCPTHVEANSSQLTKCLECDEKRCGPAFIRCAGANRRRSGIQSDIERNYSHVCKKVDWGPGAGT